MKKILVMSLVAASFSLTVFAQVGQVDKQPDVVSEKSCNCEKSVNGAEMQMLDRREASINIKRPVLPTAIKK